MHRWSALVLVGTGLFSCGELAACSGSSGPTLAAGGDGDAGAPAATADGATTGADGAPAADGAGPGSGDSGAGGGSAKDAAPLPCSAPPGPNEVCRNGLPTPIAVMLPAQFSMDRTEVTRSEYAAWLATKPATAGQAPECQANTTFTPDAACMASKLVCATGCDAHPQVCVDWCDAAAYCAAVGEHLCGAQALASGTVVFADYDNAERDEYEYECTADGKQLYVYGNTYDKTACNTGCTGTGCKTIPVASNAKCQGEPGSAAFPGVFDLQGNAAEWDGVCASADPGAQCRVRGGDMQSTATTSACDYGAGAALVARNVAGPTVGFRCCAAP